LIYKNNTLTILVYTELPFKGRFRYAIRLKIS